MEACTGILGHRSVHSADPEGCVHQEIATATGSQSTFDSVQLFDADNAADEQTAGRMLAGIYGTPGAFPNIKVQLQDQTHSATRCAGCDNE